MKKRFILILPTLLFSSFVFADAQDMGMGDSATCKVVASACKSAGYAKRKGEKFWMACMKPVLLGQSVKGVNITPDQAKACRMQKIDELQKELKAFQEVGQ